MPKYHRYIYSRNYVKISAVYVVYVVRYCRLPLPCHRSFMSKMCCVRPFSVNETLVFSRHKATYEITLKISGISIIVQHFLLNISCTIADTETGIFCFYGCYVTMTLILIKIVQFSDI